MILIKVLPINYKYRERGNATGVYVPISESFSKQIRANRHFYIDYCYNRTPVIGRSRRLS